MRKTINCKILVFSMLLFSGLFALFNFSRVSAAASQSIDVYSNIYNASNIINAEFEYEIIASPGNPVGAIDEPTSLKIKFNDVRPTGNLATVVGKIDFSNTTFSSPGTYKYTVREVSSSNPDYAISSESYEIYVVVTPSIFTVYQQAKNLNDGTKGNLNFNHEPEYSYVTIDLTTLGDEVDKNQYFRFKLDIDSLCMGCTYEIIGQDEYVNYNGQTIKTNGNYTVNNNGLPNYIYLKHGQKVTIGLTSNGEKQIPIGTKVAIFGDENLSTRKWTMFMDNIKARAASYTVNGEVNVKIAMERNMLVPNTGIFMESLPYLVLMILGGLGFIGFWKLKKNAR